MSWHLECVGTKEESVAAIDQEVASSGGMPAGVGAYLKDAIANSQVTANELVHIKSNGHRPLARGSTEVNEVRIIQRGPSQR